MDNPVPWLCLGKKSELRLFPTSPFDFDSTLHKPDHFPSADTAWESGIRWQTMRWQGKPLGLKFVAHGNREQPEITLLVWSEDDLQPGELDALSAEITYRLNLQLDLQEFNHQFGDDPHMQPVLEQWRGMRPASYSSLYEYLIIAIVLQNATIRRSVAMLQALLEHYGTRLNFDGKTLYCFWQPEILADVPEQALRDLKLGYRAKSIKRVTEAFTDQKIDEFVLRSKPKDVQRMELLNLYGIGPASVGYLLFDVYHHWDELNTISPWEQKIYSKLFFDTDVEKPVPVDHLISFFTDHFGDYRMLAVHYIWEDLFWKRKNQPVAWLEQLIRL